MQVLLEPSDGRVLGRRHGLPLPRHRLLAAHEAAVDDAGVVHVVERQVEFQQRLERVRLQLRRESGVDLGRQELDGDGQVGDVVLDEPRRVAHRDHVHELLPARLRGQVADAPAAVAEADGAEPLEAVFALQRLRACFHCGEGGRPSQRGCAFGDGNVYVAQRWNRRRDRGSKRHKGKSGLLTLWAPGLARVRICQTDQVDLVEAVFLNRLPVDDPAVEEVGHVDGDVGLARVVVGEQARVGVLPAEDVVDEEDGGVLVVARHVAVVVGELDLLARWRAAPREGLETTRTERHCLESVLMSGEEGRSSSLVCCCVEKEDEAMRWRRLTR